MRLRLVSLALVDEEADDLACGTRIEISGRFIGEDQGRLVDQRPGEPRAALLAHLGYQRDAVAAEVAAYCGSGEGSGIGGTSTRGHKGAKSRAGWTSRPGYQGGATPFMRRFPKRGFKNGFRTLFHVVNVQVLGKHFDAGATVEIAALAKLGLVPDATLPLKVLGHGDLGKKLTVVAAKFSASAKEKIEKAGGTAKVAE